MQIQHRHIVAAGALGVAAPVGAGAIAIQEPFYIITAAVALAVAIIAASVDRWFAVVPAIIGAALVLAITPILAEMLQHPDSVFDFAPAVMGAPGALIALAFGVADLAGRKRHVSLETPCRVIRGLAGAAVAVSAAAVVSAALTVTNRSSVSAEQRAGAEVIRYETSKVDRKSIEGVAGRPIRIVVENHDLYLHDFAVRDAGVAIDLGPKDEKFVEFTIVQPGEYRYVCTLHDNMKGTLVVR